ncbi:MAG: nitroreductase family protein [Candidatus Nanohaloarchaeota archaeon QJJ-7]|nr:nitroreductase family protein [Candidatus Nanohaloarchaeota archaeon QJJ-7]
MDVLEAITSRVSITSYRDTGVDRPKVARLLEAARWAPSAGNMQVSEYVIVEDEELLEKLSEYAHNQSHIREAPFALVILADIEKAERNYPERGELYALQETAAAMQNVLLEAHNQGLGAAWVGSFDEEQVGALLEVPERLRPVSIVTVGHPDEKPEQPHKYDITNITYQNKYGKRVHPMYEKVTWKGLRHYGKKLKKMMP